MKIPNPPPLQPLDVRDLVVLYETEGLTDSIAFQEFGLSDRWEVAAERFAQACACEEARPKREPSPHGVVEYLRGISFALPLLCCLVSMLLFQFSLWGGALSANAAAAVGLGTISSFVVTGGFVQAMSRRGMFFSGIREYRACAQSIKAWLLGGFLCLTLTALIQMAGNAYFGWLPWRLNLIAVAFHQSLGVFWLAAGVLYMLDRSLLVTLATLAGIASVIVLHRGLGLELLLSQIVSILLGSAIALLTGAIVLRGKIPEGPSRMRPQPLGRVVYLMWQYFAYGLFYYFFLFTDRLLAWTAHAGVGASLVQFRGDYETALDLALFCFIAQVGWIRSSTMGFVHRLRHCESIYSVNQIQELNTSLHRFYWTRLGLFLPLAVASGVGVYAATSAGGFLKNAVMRQVMVCSLLAYPFMAIALWNVSLLFTLSKPFFVLKAIASASLVNLLIGYLSSRVGSYHQSVFGFLAGALLFMWLSSIYLLRVLRRADYHYYASAL